MKMDIIEKLVSTRNEIGIDNKNSKKLLKITIITSLKV